MTLFRKTQTASIQGYFLRIFIPIVLLVSTIISGLMAWNDYQTSKSSRLESQRLTFETFMAVIKQPLIQGSLIEARIRADELARNVQVACIKINSVSDTIEACNHLSSTKSGLHQMEKDLYFGDDRASRLGHLSITFDNSDLISTSWKNIGKNIIGFILLSVILFAGLSIGFSRIRKELKELMKIVEAQNGKQVLNPTFRISEFSTLGTILSYQFEVSKSAAEAKAALDVAKQVAHDIRSPIVSLQVALNAAKNQLDPKIRHVINQSAQRISDIANDVLNQHSNSNKSNRANPRLAKLPMSVDLALNDIIAEKNLVHGITHSITKSATPKNEDFFIEMRVSDFKRVLSNVIDNAIQATSEGGLIEISLHRQMSDCCVSISDNGIGISPAILDTLIEEGGSFGKESGKGLGLQWTRKTLETHGGRLQMTSQVGVGTQVRLFLPTLPVHSNQVETVGAITNLIKEA